MTTQHVTPAVRVTAERLGVDLAQVQGTGSGGRITVDDVRAASPQRRAARDALVDQARATRTSGRLSGVQMRVKDNHLGVDAQVDATSRNPLLNALQKSRPDVARAALKIAPAPTLFAAGDLPPFTASGVPPTQLLNLPWHLRHVAAQESDRSALSRMFEQYIPVTEGTASYAALSHGAAPGNVDYQDRFRSWVTDGYVRTQEDRPRSDTPAPGSGLPTYGLRK